METVDIRNLAKLISVSKTSRREQKTKRSSNEVWEERNKEGDKSLRREYSEHTLRG